MSEKKKFIRDSVYGDINLNKFEVSIMDMPQFQRLRRIKQLGLISLIYPGANHTRFEHSIGTMNLGSKLAEELELEKDEIELIKESYSNTISIGVMRPNFDNGLTSDEKKHPTEIDLDDYDNYDYKIINDGNLLELEQKVEKILEEVKL